MFPRLSDCLLYRRQVWQKGAPPDAKTKLNSTDMTLKPSLLAASAMATLGIIIQTASDGHMYVLSSIENRH
jgi:hypothetical protein